MTDAPSLITFNPAFLRGTAGTNPDLSVFEGETNLPPGQYDVDVYVNGVFVRSASLQFQRAGNGVTACLSRQLVVDAGVLESAIVTPWPDAECKPIAAAVKGAAEYFDSSRMRVDLTVPQASLQHVPRGFVPQSAWDSGETTGFVNYSGSYYSNSYRRGAAYSLDSTYFNLQSGINAGMWQWRNSSSVRHTGRGGTEFSYGNTFARRALPGWRSEFTVGETSTSGTLFDAVGFRGMRLTSDERMLSPNRQGYAPVVRGIAYSNARVVIRQGASVVYETSVPPGEFVLDDLYPTLNSGDLTVQVTEADGSVRSFVVPFSAVAGSLRPGLSRYAVTVGRTHTGFTGADNVWFGEATYERGISNAVTVNAGAQFASNNYLSTALGGVLATPFGAFGTGANFSHVRLAGTPSTGWQMKLTYNTAFASTGTSVTLAGYRYSTQGYRSLADTLTQGAVPFMLDDMGTRIRSSTFRQRNRFELMLSQQLGRYGSINASGVRQDYYDEYHPGTQFQIGYQNSIGRIGYNLSVSRQSYASVNAADRTQTVVMLSVSVPLELGRRGATLTSSVSRYSDQGSVLQSTLIGTAGARNEYSYSVNVARDTGNHVSRGGVTAGRSTSFGAFGLGYSYGSDASVFSAYARGSLVAHRAGVLFGPYVADTFGIVEAEDAAGARLTNADGIVLNRAGYGIVPSLAPYRYNTVTLDPAGMPGNVELEETQKRVAPYAGAIPKIRFRTRTGYAVLIDVSLEGGGRLPIGARVVDAQGRDVGVVGQGSRLYARVKQPAGVLSVSLGSGTDKCMVAYDVSKQDRTQALMHTESVCRVSRTGTDALAHDATPPADRYRADRADAVRIR
ncbi:MULTISPECIES: fimbria/pilus outer membrane usher protein [unclassified Burkholderia]|uniref:fimbria/pilus outer membrane usher protein n=1 Tax=unclassified Burkholderia TaxID=2613784 RepID=UPI002ABE1693|nr:MULTISPECIES: fimbria/pilus outer membrane usher protein [unclassified Burkholderia]